MADVEEASLCTFCDSSAVPDLRCPHCKKDFCCEMHSELHSAREGDNKCFPFLIKQSESVGRIETDNSSCGKNSHKTRVIEYLIASRDIRAGETVFCDEPLVFGPNQQTTPLCPTCCDDIDCTDPSSFHLCPSCSYPFCDTDCASDPSHASECSLLTLGEKEAKTLLGNNGVDMEDYAYMVVLPLRLALLKKLDPERFALTDKMMDHRSRRIEDSYWQQCQDQIVDRILALVAPDSFTASELHRLIGITEVNGYEIHARLRSGFRGLFPLGSLLSHRCSPNVKSTYSKEAPFTAKCVALTDIDAGSELFSSYWNTMTATISRRRIIRDHWYFECGCERCSDPTENGSYIGAMKCAKCGGRVLTTDPLNFSACWRCESCPHEMSSAEVEAILEKLQASLEEITLNDRYSVPSYLSLLTTARPLVSPSHAFMCDLTKWLAPVFCRARDKTLKDFPLEHLELKRSLCEEQIKVMERVSPGAHRDRAKIAFEHMEVSAFLAKHGGNGSKKKNKSKKDFSKSSYANTKTSVAVWSRKEVKMRGREILAIFQVYNDSLNWFEKWMVDRTKEIMENSDDLF